MTDLTHFYHLYAGAGAWRDPLAEHLAALEDSAFDGRFVVGIVGSAEQRDEVRHELDAIRPPDAVILADEGWEQVTLDALYQHAQEASGAVLYAHSKGAGFPSPFQDAWRRSMTSLVVGDWRMNLAPLETQHVDAVGCHWLTPEQYPGVITVPMFGGNFWMATCELIRRLPPCATNTRHDAEAWIGHAAPRARVIDLAPGWPGHGSFVVPRVRRLIASR